MLNLASKDLELILHILKKHVPHNSVYAYGSRVTGKSHSGSDLDLVIMGKNIISIAEIREAFRQSNLPMTVDIFYWDDIPAAFKEEINKQKIQIFPRKVVSTASNSRWT